MTTTKLYTQDPTEDQQIETIEQNYNATSEKILEYKVNHVSLVIVGMKFKNTGMQKNALNERNRELRYNATISCSSHITFARKLYMATKAEVEKLSANTDQ
jgi:hypothetical protein